MTPPGFPTTPSDMIAELERVAADLLDAVQGLSDDDLRTPRIAGEWRGQDILAHLARWDTIARQEIEAERGGQPSGEGYANYLEINDQWAALDRAFSPGQARARFEAAHAALFALLRSLRVDEWTPLVRRWARHAVWLHYPEHTAQFQAWRDSHGH